MSNQSSNGDSVRAFLRALRERLGMSLNQFADEAGIPVSTYFSWEVKGTGEVRLGMLRRILRKLKLPWSILDEVVGKSAADVAALAERVAFRLVLEEQIRSDPTNDELRQRYIRLTVGDLVLDRGYSTATAKEIAERALAQLVQSPPDA